MHTIGPAEGYLTSIHWDHQSLYTFMCLSHNVILEDNLSLMAAAADEHYTVPVAQPERHK